MTIKNIYKSEILHVQLPECKKNWRKQNNGDISKLSLLQCLKHWQRSQDSCTPLKINVEAQNWWFVDLSPFSRSDFQVSCQFFYTSKLDEGWCMAARFESLSFVFSNVFSMAKYGYHTPPRTNGWNPKMEIWKMVVLFNWVIFRFHVNFHGCNRNPLGNKHVPSSLVLGNDSFSFSLWWDMDSFPPKYSYRYLMPHQGKLTLEN